MSFDPRSLLLPERAHFRRSSMRTVATFDVWVPDFCLRVAFLSPFLVEGFDFRHQRKITPLLCLMKGLHVRQTLVPISNEGVAFSTAIQAKGLHFPPWVLGSGAFLPKGSHFLPQTASHVSTCRIGRERVRKHRFSIRNRYSSARPNI